MTHSAHDAADPAAGMPPRRSFFIRALAATIGAVVGLAPLVPGVAFLLDPILRKRRRPSERPAPGDEGFVKVAMFDALPADGLPQKFTVYDDLQDAWNFVPHQQVGSVWLRRKGNGVQCFNTRCPHLGCTVDFKSSEKTYFCPCHTSSFDLDGEKLNVIPPRGMDELEATVVEGVVLVKFQKFRAATPEKIPVE